MSREIPSRRSIWILIGLVGVLLGGFAGGVLFEHEKVFPHARLMSALRKLKGAPPSPRSDATAPIEAQRTIEGGSQTFRKEIDSALLPLRLEGFKLSARFSVAKSAGGIAAVGGNVIVVDRLGAFFALQNGQLRSLSFPKLPSNVEGFVRQAALSPDNFRVHDVEYLPAEAALAVSHELFDEAAGQTRLAVSLMAFDAEKMESRGDWRTIWRGAMAAAGEPPASPGGGRLAGGSGRRLFLTTIDYIPDDFSAPAPNAAQNPESLFGKIVQIDLPTGRSEIVSRGHRNPQGLVLTRSGELLSTEHGPGGGDELNVIVPGGNYGWPRVTLGTEYNSYNWPSGDFLGRHDGYTAPLFAWTPAVAPSHLIEVHGFHPRWEGDLLVASLKAGTLFRLRREGNRVLYSEPIWIGERIRDLIQLADGTVVLWTDDANLLMVKVDEAKLAGKRMLLDTSPPALAACLKCHHFGPTTPAHLAPSLSNLIERSVASDDFSRYSPALKSVGGAWNVDRLRQFLTEPSRFAAGTTMPKSDLTDADREMILAELLRQSVD